MIKAKIHNCNNIISANIVLRKFQLSIRYAINGTGKSTIAKSIEFTSSKKGLSEPKPFGTEDKQSCVLSANIEKVMRFDEEFVSTYIF